MTHQVSWKLPNQILLLELQGDQSLDDFHQINLSVLDLLGPEMSEKTLTILVDITQPGTTPRAFDQLRASQTYMMRRDLKFILVAGKDKFMRLMMMLTFNKCRPGLRFFDNMEQALAMASVVSRSHASGEVHVNEG